MYTSHRVPAPRKRRLPVGRRLVAVDIENAVGGAIKAPESVAWTRRVLTHLGALAGGDTVVIGTCHRGLLPIGCTWTGVRYVVRSGPDGADLALLEVLDEHISERFSEVVLVSGDGRFAEAVATLEGEGVKVVVVAHREGLSRRLAMAASQALYFDEHWDDSPGTFGDAA